jgi:hypothetical protein
MPQLLGRVRAVSFLAFSLALLHLAGTARAQVLTRAVTLLWTATGDNGLVGQAAKYDLRYTGSAISGTDTLSWWNIAAVISMTNHVPPPSGSRDSVVIAGLVEGKKYYAMMRVADAAGNWSGFSNIAVMDLTKDVTGVVTGEVAAPKLVLGAPYPSPTAGPAQIALETARSGPLEADVFDARGRRVRTLYQGVIQAGSHTLRWDGSAEGGAQAAAGVYWIRVAAHGVHKSAKIIVLR